MDQEVIEGELIEKMTGSYWSDYYVGDDNLSNLIHHYVCKHCKVRITIEEIA